MKAAALTLAEWGVKEVCITLGSYGSVIYDGTEFAIVPAFPTREVVDATGCGDTYSTGYLYKRACGASIADARDASQPANVVAQIGSISGPFSVRRWI